MNFSLNFSVYAQNFMYCLYIIVARNIYVPTRVKIRWMWKSTDRKSEQAVKNNVTIKLDDMSWKWYDLLLESNTIEFQDFLFIWTCGAPQKRVPVMMTVSAITGSLTADLFTMIHYVCIKIGVSWVHKENTFKYFLLFKDLIKQMIWLPDKSICSHTHFIWLLTSNFPLGFSAQKG